MPADVRSGLPVRNDRNYVYVPVGYLDRDPKHVDKIINALDLQLPNLVITTAETGPGNGGDCVYKVQDAGEHQVAKDWTENHTAEVLKAKVAQLLRSTVDSGIEVGAWIMPQCPRRRDGGTRMICEALSNLGDNEPYVALGVLGLDKQDEAEGLTASIQSNMVPLGSPVKSVSRIDYDKSLKDSAPCPELTHLLIFESAHEKARFAQELLDLVPDILLAFGDITRTAMKSVFDNTLAGSPIVLLKHTGENVDALCRMFKHVREHIAKVEYEKKLAAKADAKKEKKKKKKLLQMVEKVGTEVAVLNPLTPGPEQEETIQKQQPATGNQVINIPPIPDEQDDLIRLFINTWPSNFNGQSVVLADPLLLNGPAFQKRILASITATFDLKMGGEDTQNAKRKALQYAWSFYDIAHKHSKLRKRSAENLHLQLVIFTLVSIIASVLYDQAYGGGGSPTGGFQLFVFVMTILLPLYITSLKQESDNNNPVVRWAAFRVAAARLESEIFKFRAQVGPYRAADKTERSMQEPLRHFSKKTQDIWLGIKQFLHDDGMEISDNFWEYGDSTPATSASKGKKLPKPKQKGKIKSFFSTISARLPTLKKTKVDAADDVPANETTPILGDTFMDETFIGNIQEKHSGDAQEETSPGKMESNLAEDVSSVSSSQSSSIVEMPPDEEDPVEEPFVDDRYSPLTAEQYIDCRMKGNMRSKADDLQLMVGRNSKISKTIKLVTIFSGATAALSLQWAVPIVLGVTAALGTGQEFRKYTRRIELGNVMVVQLNELKLWWIGLSMYQRQLPHNKDRLIQNAEHIIITEIASSFDGQSVEKDD